MVARTANSSWDCRAAQTDEAGACSSQRWPYFASKLYKMVPVQPHQQVLEKRSWRPLVFCTVEMCVVSTLEFFSSTYTMAGVQVWCFMLSFKPELLCVKLPEFGRLQRYSQKPDADVFLLLESYTRVPFW